MEDHAAMADSSFDIVSKIDRQEVDNALNQAAKEISQRYDFKGTGAEIKWSGEKGSRSPRNAEDRANAVLEVFKEKLIKRAAVAEDPRRRRAAAVRQGDQDQRRPQGGHQLRGRQEGRQADPRRGPQGRQGAGPGRRAARLVARSATTCRPCIALVKGQDFDFAVQFTNYR